MSAPSEAVRAKTLSERLGIRPAIVELGHAHPAVRRVLQGAGGTLSFLVTLDDDRIEALEVEIGIGHRGFEKEVESRPWQEAPPYVARLGWAGGAIARIAYCLAVERLADLALPPSAIWHRTLVCELARVTDHLARVAALAAAIAASAAERIARSAELAAMTLLETSLGGSPFTAGALPGGMTAPLPEGFDATWQAGRGGLERALGRLSLLLLEQGSAVDRLMAVAPLGREDALAWAVTGPCLRASGVARDRRRDDPGLAYAELDFSVPIGTLGDDYDRLAVVFEEVRQSLWLVEQCVCRMRGTERGAAGAIGVGGEALVVPAGEVEVALESSTGELAFHLVSDGGPLPRRIRCRAPSFFHAQALPAVLRGARLDDLLPTVALFHVVSGECDR
ncbi:MAG: hypothetical protein R3F35_24240 [Myxococcota bacterium]